MLHMHPAIAQHRDAIAASCLRYRIRRLVEFAEDAPPDLRSFYGAKSKLEQLLGRGVDLVEPGAVRNPYVLASINRHREPVYAA